MSAIQLTPHFWLSEFITSNEATRRGIRNVPDPMVVLNIVRTAELLEEVRSACGDHALILGSGFRCAELNTVVGGSPGSEHMTGDAVDFTIPAFGNPLAICKAILKKGIKFGQLIYEGDWVHISRPGRFQGQVLTARFVRDPLTGKVKAKYVPGLPS